MHGVNPMNIAGLLEKGGWTDPDPALNGTQHELHHNQPGIYGVPGGYGYNTLFYN